MIKGIVTRFAKDVSGATAVEYAVIVGIIALAIIVGLGGIRDNLNNFFNTANTELSK